MAYNPHGSEVLPKSFLILAAPTPTNISSNSEPETKKNGTSASPAIALASRVLPVPGGPIRRRPSGKKERGEGRGSEGEKK